MSNNTIIYGNVSNAITLSDTISASFDSGLITITSNVISCNNLSRNGNITNSSNSGNLFLSTNNTTTISNISNNNYISSCSNSGNINLNANTIVIGSVIGSAYVNGNLTLTGNLNSINNNLIINSNLNISGNQVINGKLTSSTIQTTSLNILGNINSNININGNQTIIGNSNLNGTLTVNGNQTINGKLTINGNLSIKSNIVFSDGSVQTTAISTFSNIAGTYTSPSSITLNNKGQITAIMSGSGGSVYSPTTRPYYVYGTTSINVGTNFWSILPFTGPLSPSTNLSSAKITYDSGSKVFRNNSSSRVYISMSISIWWDSSVTTGTRRIQICIDPGSVLLGQTTVSGQDYVQHTSTTFLLEPSQYFYVQVNHLNAGSQLLVNGYNFYEGGILSFCEL